MLSSTLLQLIVQGFIGRDIKDAQVPAMIEKLEAWYVPRWTTVCTRGGPPPAPGVDHCLHQGWTTVCTRGGPLSAPGVDHRLHHVTSLEGSCLSGALKVVPDTLHMAVYSTPCSCGMYM